MTRLALSMLLLATIPASTPVPPLSAGGQPSVKPEPLPGKAVTRLRNGGHLSTSGSRALHRPARRADRDEQRAPLLAVTMYCYTGSKNAAGKWPTVGTAAGNAWPLGTRLRVESVGVVTVEDRSAPGATDVDLFGGSDSGCAPRAAAWGRRYLHVSEVAA